MKRIKEGADDVHGRSALPTAQEIGPDAVNGGDTLLTVHRSASRLYNSGAFDKATMRRFDELCLTQVEELAADEIKQLRELSGVSQAVLARILNVTTSTVGQWERGEKKPTGSALKLLALMRSKGVGAVL
ncbi:MAG TPA: DNA-binding transcriptional regulator [Fimbriimonas sp.]|nr:DNA-binding transcriptional regulator [Fimbriimonas sp.]